MYPHPITIEVVKGGFVLSYTTGTVDKPTFEREVFTSQRKLTQKLKEVLDAAAPGTEDKE